MSTPRSILTMRRAWRNTTSTWRGSFPHCRAYCSAQGEGVTSLRAIKQPSALDTIFWVMTTMSPACSDNGAATAAWWISATRSAPGVTMGMPGRPITRSSGRFMKHAHRLKGKGAFEAFKDTERHERLPTVARHMLGRKQRQISGLVDVECNSWDTPDPYPQVALSR